MLAKLDAMLLTIIIVQQNKTEKSINKRLLKLCDTLRNLLERSDWLHILC